MLKGNGFIIGLIIMITLAWFFPQIGLYDGFANLNQITNIGITLIFFFYGLKLSPTQMKEGLSNYRLHILVQLATFVLFPLIVLVFKPFIHTSEQQMIWLSIFFLAILPSTVSSSVVMVVLAKGNVPGAIFNASISGLIGIVVTPLWMGLFWEINDNGLNFSSIIIDLLLQILLPVIIGLWLHRYFGAVVKKHLKALSTFDKTVILLIVYKSFSQSFSGNLFTSMSIGNIILISVASIGLFGLVYLLIHLFSTLLHFNREDKITALFCGSKKSLIHGSVFAKVMFQNSQSQGLLLIPIMIYHSLQLIIISFIANRMRKDIGE